MYLPVFDMFTFVVVVGVGFVIKSKPGLSGVYLAVIRVGILKCQKIRIKNGFGLTLP